MTIAIPKILIRSRRYAGFLVCTIASVVLMTTSCHETKLQHKAIESLVILPPTASIDIGDIVFT